MLSSVARPRRLIVVLLSLLPLVRAKDDSLFTSSVTYCEPPETLFIEQFDLTYFAKNTSISFNISAASVESNVNVTANIAVNVYGLHPFSFQIDLCSLLHGALCPLPMYNFTGADSLTLPSSLGIAQKIPAIAYKIPDLEAFAQLTLVETSTGIVKACVQSTLSNGWSTHQKGVEWSTGGLALLALLSAIWQSLSPDALAPYRLLDLIYLYQSIATTAFLDLNYPTIYRAFTLNFSWAMGLFDSQTLSSIQRSINNMRHLTGGTMADSSGGSVVGLVNRRLSPYNENALAPASAIQSLANMRQTYVAALSNLDDVNYTSAVLRHSSNLIAGGVATVTQASSNVLQAGVPIYTNTLGIATANAFMSVFFSVLILVGILFALLALGYAVVFALSCANGKQQNRFLELRYRYPAFARAWCLRLCLVVFPPVVIFACYQWSLKDSWLSILLSVLLLVAVASYIAYVAFLTLRIARKDSPFALFTNTEYLASHGPLYAQYRTPRFYFMLPLIAATFLKAIFIASAQSAGEVQIILMLVVEFGVLATYIVLKPFKTRGGDVLGTYLAIVRFICTGLMVAFIQKLALGAIPRVVVGAVAAVLFSFSVIVLFINIVMHLPGVNHLFRKSPQRSQSDSASESIMEKGDSASPTATESHTHFGRPRNPTPERNVHMDPHTIQSYSSTLTDIPATPRSPASVDTNSTNLGTVLPRRWSFQRSSNHSHSPSDYSTSPHFSDFSSPRRSVPPSPLTASIGHGHSRQPTIEEYSYSSHAL